MDKMEATKKKKRYSVMVDHTRPAEIPST